jgi:Domain of unknown function (DUF4387)
LTKAIRSKNIPDSRVSDHVEFDPAMAIKFTIYRDRPSGSLGDADFFGSQQYGPLLGIMVPARQSRMAAMSIADRDGRSHPLFHADHGKAIARLDQTRKVPGRQHAVEL